MDSLPRQGTVVYDLIYGTVKQKKRAIKKFRFLNTYIINPLYRIGLLPLLGFGRIFLLLDTIGRKSSKRRITPLEYHRISGVIHVISARGDRSDWFRNLQANPDKASVKIGFHRLKPKIEVLDDPKEAFEVLKWYVTTHPTLAKYLMGWSKETDEPELGILNPLVDCFRIVKIHETK